ncbi:MAG: M28 family peptidase [Saprospiraceae bacterium]|nr:M28 family peptidase [Saprospiraceae bacterium]
MNNLMKWCILLMSLSLGIVACETDKPTGEGGAGVDVDPPPIKNKVKAPKFDKDKAYGFVKTQVDFGSRVPGSVAHDSCAQWLVAQLESFGAETIMQNGETERHDGKRFPVKNIIGSFNPNAKKRVLLCAHWDSRYLADHDDDESRHNEPILGADDGASGVGVLLEIARQIQQQPLEKIGVDIIFFDMEDQGISGVPNMTNSDKTWCLGSQYWARNKHKSGYDAEYGILLDMVGSKNARFPKEGFSVEHVGPQVNRIWKKAKEKGFGKWFVDQEVGPIIDDHVFVTTMGGIPTLDIINLPGGGRTFGHYWHTHKDNMDVIDKHTLKAVGQTVLTVLYEG